MEGFLGTGASFAADLTLIAYILIITPVMLLGFVFARQKKFIPHHKLAMTFVVILNWILIIFVMAASYAGGVAPGLSENLTEPPILIPTIHLITGGLAQIIATYLIILMWTEKTSLAFILPDSLRIKNIKTPMRLTLGLWLVTVVLGIGIYVTWYVGSPGGDAPPPAATEEPTDGDSEAAPVATEEASSEDEDEAEPAATEEEASEDASDTDEAGDDTEETDSSSSTEDEEVPEPAATEEAG